jgi:hypothetical protein
MLPRRARHARGDIVRAGRGSSAAILLGVTALVCGCGTSSTSTVTTGPEPVRCPVSLAAVPTIDAAGGAGSVAVTTQPECGWDASSNVAWIFAVSPASGQGAARVSFRVEANEDTAAREGMILINGQQTLVSQRAPCRYHIGPATQTMAPSGGIASITISTEAECAWTAASDASWISPRSSATGSGNGTVAFNVTLNDGARRTGSISVVSQLLSVIQESSGGRPAPPPPPPPPPSNPCEYGLDPSGDYVHANEGAGGVRVFASPPTCTWTAVSSASWLLISSGATGTGNGAVQFHVQENFGPRRTATLTIAGLTFTVIQEAPPQQIR